MIRAGRLSGSKRFFPSLQRAATAILLRAHITFFFFLVHASGWGSEEGEEEMRERAFFFL